MAKKFFFVFFQNVSRLPNLLSFYFKKKKEFLQRYLDHHMTDLQWGHIWRSWIQDYYYESEFQNANSDSIKDQFPNLLFFCLKDLVKHLFYLTYSLICNRIKPRFPLLSIQKAQSHHQVILSKSGYSQKALTQIFKYANICLHHETLF